MGVARQGCLLVKELGYSMLPLLSWKVAHPNRNSSSKSSCEIDSGQVYLLTGFHSFPCAAKLRFLSVLAEWQTTCAHKMWEILPCLLGNIGLSLRQPWI